MQVWLMMFLYTYIYTSCSPNITRAMKRPRDDTEDDEIWQTRLQLKKSRKELQTFMPRVDPLSEDVMLLLSVCRLCNSCKNETF